MNNISVNILDLASEAASLEPQLSEKVVQILKSGAYVMGPEVEQLERETAAFLGVKHAIGLNSGTDALIIGLRAAGIQSGDEVITTAFSFFATAEAIEHCGATPVFIDIDPNNFNFNLAEIEKHITPKTKAILPVHIYGQACNMSAILKIAKKYNLKIIEDCAQSFGATWEGKQTGSFGDVGCFSFFPTKNLGAYGDGGLLVTNDDLIAQEVRILRDHGSKIKYHHERLGYNSRLDAIQAGILNLKLPKIKTWNQARRDNAHRYNTALAHIDGLITPQSNDGHVFHQYTLLVKNNKRDELQAYLKQNHITAMIYYPIPFHKLPYYQNKPDFIAPNLPVSEQISAECLSLPIHPFLSLEQQAHVIQTILNFFK